MFKLLTFVTLMSATIAAVPVHTLPATETITLTKTNHVVLQGVVEPTVMNAITAQIVNSPESELYLYIMSPGGYVDAGMNFIQNIKASGKKVHCITDYGYSMAFVITQLLCDTRLVLPNSILMQHQPAFGVRPAPVKHVLARLKMTLDANKIILERQAARIGISPEQLDELTTSDLWVYGEDNVKLGTADKVVYVRCESSVTPCPTTSRMSDVQYKLEKAQIQQLNTIWLN